MFGKANVWVHRCLMNWRWWAALPVMAIMGIVSALLQGNATFWRWQHEAHQGLARSGERLMKRAYDPLVKWVIGGWR